MKSLWPAFSYIHQLKERLLPRPFERIAMAKLNCQVGAEIGVFEGEHARLLLRNANVAKLYLVDPYKAYTDYDSNRLNQAFDVARKKLAPYSHKCQWCLCNSSTAAAFVPSLLDFTYIDGAHDFNSVASDISIWYPKIKPGGILGGHDFSNGTFPEHSGVIQAVTKFVVENNLKLHVELSDWWIIKP